MSEFIDAIKVILEHEGGYSNELGDPGGVTNFGLTHGFCLGCLVEMPTTTEEAISIYHRFIWNRNFEQIHNQTLATKAFDIKVNTGNVRVVQKAVNCCGQRVREDGDIGPATVAAINDCDSAHLLRSIQENQRNHYVKWVNAHPVDRDKFRKGLEIRAAWPSTPKRLGWTTD